MKTISSLSRVCIRFLISNKEKTGYCLHWKKKGGCDLIFRLFFPHISSIAYCIVSCVLRGYKTYQSMY